jgi:hypothetical protein
MENQDKFKENENISWYVFIGCMFIGIGIGMALDKAGVGTIVGMGVGFLASAMHKSEKNKYFF